MKISHTIHDTDNKKVGSITKRSKNVYTVHIYGQTLIPFKNIKEILNVFNYEYWSIKAV